MKSAKFVAVAIVVAAIGTIMLSATARAYDFANICPPQAPQKWAVSAETWSQFVDSCVANEASARAGRAFDRRFWDNCVRTCGLADEAQGRTPPTPAPRNQLTTSGSPANPNWCPGVPASPPPPHYQAENRPNDWADTSKRCMNVVGVDVICTDACQAARELWQRSKEGTLNQPFTLPAPTDQLQGPFPLPGGAKGYILPVPPTPVSQQPHATSTSVSTPSRFPEKAPPGWDQKKWDHITKACYQIAEKARSHKPVSRSEFEICTSLSWDFLTPNSPPPDAFFSSQPATPARSATPPESGQPQSQGFSQSVLAASSVGPDFNCDWGVTRGSQC
jgi:hypothetical protein